VRRELLSFGGRNDLNFLATVGHDPALWGEGAGMNITILGIPGGLCLCQGVENYPPFSYSPKYGFRLPVVLIGSEA